MRQITNTLFMVRPARFGYNEDTAKSNHFQSAEGKDDEDIPVRGLKEFDGAVEQLREAGIDVIVVDDLEEPYTPDAIFPNNWISFHENGTMITYAMESPVRQREIREDVLEMMEKEHGFTKQYNFQHYIEEKLYLEGTGSMILDRVNKVVYCCLSPRTHIELISKFCILMNYRSEYFYSYDQNKNPIYHTNVMMALGEELAIVCMESIPDPEEKESLLKVLAQTNKTLVDITLDQANQFAGNMLELRTKDMDRIMVMSQAAFDSLRKDQISAIEAFDKILVIDIPTIEKYGGGSIRCMMAEVFKQ